MIEKRRTVGQSDHLTTSAVPTGASETWTGYRRSPQPPPTSRPPPTGPSDSPTKEAARPDPPLARVGVGAGAAIAIAPFRTCAVGAAPAAKSR